MTIKLEHEETMNVKALLIAALKDIGADGLCCNTQCECGINDFFAFCGCINLNECEAAKIQYCSDCPLYPNDCLVYNVNSGEHPIGFCYQPMSHYR